MLSDSERANMTRVIREYAAMKPVTVYRGDTSITVSYRWFTFAHRPMAAALVLVLIFGSSVSYAAENALPGDTLYTVKTYINEPTRVALATNAEAKAEVQIELAERRIEEAAVLAAEGRLDEEIEDDLAIAFESHAEAVAEHISEADEDDEGISMELASRFENRLAAHGEILLEVDGVDEAPHSARLAEAIRAASNQAVAISIGNALATGIDATLAATSDTEAEPESAEGAEPATMMTVASDTPEPAADARTATFAAAQAETPLPDAKKIARIKAAAEKSLKNSHKKLKGVKALSSEARERAEADLALADSLLAEGSQHLEADADAEAYAAFKESFRVSEQANVYMKAAPTLEKARSRAKNNRAILESRIEPRIESHDSETTVEVGPVNATVTIPHKEAADEDEPEEDHPEVKEDEETSSEADVKIKPDLSL